MITIKDIAKRAGVSIATVSRVINKNYTVSPEAETKVLQVIKELNYYPNSIARSLKKDSTYTIGFLVSDISNTHLTTMAKAVEDVISKENYSMIVCSTENKKEREFSYLKLLMSRKIDGLIINTTGENDELIASLSEKLPIVCVHRRILKNNFHGDFVDDNCIQGAYDLTKHLLSLGHRKIFVLNGGLIISTGSERFEGFKRAMREAGIEVNDDYPYRYDGDFSFQAGYQGAAQMMGMIDRPTAIVIMNNTMTLGALKFFKTKGLKIPEEISVASYVSIGDTDLLYVQPTIMTQNPWVIGTKAARLLLDRIKDKELGNREIIYESQLVVGNGVKAIGQF